METRQDVQVVTLSKRDMLMAQAVLADTAAEATASFSGNNARVEMTRKAVEVASSFLGQPVRVLDFLPSLAIGEVHRANGNRT